MPNLHVIAQRVRDFQRDIPDLIRVVCEENAHILVEMNADQQLYDEGIDTRGISIDSYAPYSPLTIQIKEQKGQPTDRVTLRDTGAFEGSIYIQFTADQMTFAASDWKTEELILKYGETILGLTSENQSEFGQRYIKPALREILKVRTNLK